jgi:hypothetical protein
VATLAVLHSLSGIIDNCFGSRVSYSRHSHQIPSSLYQVAQNKGFLNNDNNKWPNGFE